ncbi:hypothetical protein OESDEN_08471 [Oesophagostomum dentatum]|uniref:Uncharacterized protein n=1 Tax=Oesophagostomum dentatum TaxID=61180 RepID=A0A0B1T379_OESDE|nr:hypothetical protein OESDEN_08471 [Oesophagostomum dentatum]
MLVTACFLLVGLGLTSAYIAPMSQAEHERKVIDCPGIENEHRQDLYENVRYIDFALVQGYKKFGCYLGEVGDERVHRKFIIFCDFK